MPDPVSTEGGNIWVQGSIWGTTRSSVLIGIRDRDGFQGLDALALATGDRTELVRTTGLGVIAAVVPLG